MEKKALQDLKKMMEDKDIDQMSNFVASKYSPMLSKDEIENCIVNAIWSAMNKFDPTRGTKFTTFLYRGVKIQCQKRINFNNKYRTNANIDLISATKSSFVKSRTHRVDKAFDEVDMRDEIENCEDPELIYDRFYNNMTLNEIAKKRNTSYETVRNKILKNLKIIRKRLV